MSFPRYESYRDSGHDWLGDVPAHWRVNKFRHCFRESAEKIETDVIGPMLSVSGYRGIEVKEYDDENRRRLDADLIGYRIVRCGQLVVNTMWLNYAGLGVSDFEGHVSPAYRSYAISDALQKRFVHHLMRCGLFVKGYSKFLTGVRPNSLQMSRDDLMVFPVLEPPQSEQAAIATFLDHETAKIDALVEEQKRLIELLKEKRQAVISHAVTKGLNPNAPMKDSGVEWLERVPAHWEVGPMKRFWSVTDCKHITAEFVEEGIPLASIREVQGWEVRLDEAKRTTAAYYEQLIEGGREPQRWDIIFTRNATVGEAALVPDNAPTFAMGQDVCLLKRQDRNYSAQFMLRQLKSTVIERQLNAIMIGSTFKRINVEEIRNMIVCMPPVVEQHQISEALASQVGNFDELLDEAAAASCLLQERRTALISAAVTGKIDVRSKVEQVEAALA